MAETTQSDKPDEVSEVKPAEPNKPKKSIWRFFSHPVWIPIGIIIGFLTTYYFFQIGKIYPQLVIYNHPVKATIVKAGQTSDIKTFYKDKEVNTDVTVAQIAIWNEGNSAIKTSQILKPIVLFTDKDAPILEATIRKSTREDITKINLNQDELQKGRLTVSWNILEQYDGGVIQIIYAGDSQININSEGVIEGQKEITKSIISAQIKSPEEQFIATQKDKTYSLIFIVFTFVLIICSSLYTYTAIKRIRNSKNKIFKSLMIGMIVIILVFTVAVTILVSILAYKQLFFNNFSPPFGLN